jgi:hypothetical protein
LISLPSVFSVDHSLEAPQFSRESLHVRLRIPGPKRHEACLKVCDWAAETEGEASSLVGLGAD